MSNHTEYPQWFIDATQRGQQAAPAPPPGMDPGVVMALGVLVGLLVLAGGLALAWFLYRRRSHGIWVEFVDPHNGPVHLRRVLPVKGQVRTRFNGKDVIVPLDKIGHPFRGSTKYYVDPTTGLPYDFKKTTREGVPGQIDGYRAADEWKSNNSEKLARSAPEGLLGALAPYMPLFVVMGFALLVPILIATGKGAGWW